MPLSARIALAFGALLSARAALAATYTPYQFVTIAGTAGTSGHLDATGAAAQFSSPDGIAVDSSGNVYVADTGNDTIREITPAGVVSTIVGLAGVAGSTDGTGSAARFSHPTGLAIDRSGNLYVADTITGSIRKITPTVAGGVTTWTTSTLTQLAYIFSLAIYPLGVTVDASGDIFYVTVVSTPPDSTINELPAGAASGLPLQIAGSVGGGYGYNNGSGSVAAFEDALGIAVDANGIIYVADTGNSAIRKVTQSTVGGVGTVTVLAGSTAGLGTIGLQAGTAGTPGSADGTQSAASFNQPKGVGVDANGNVYVADTGNDTIREISPAGVTTTLAGVPGIPGSADGTGAGALFNQPGGVAVDANGNVYVTDSGNNTIRKGSLPAIAPSFTLAASPASVTVATGRSVAFNAMATGIPAPTYQWTLNGSTTIPGATGTTDSVLLVTGATSANVGTYACTATNSQGSVSTSATLGVVTTAAPGYLTNLSSRVTVGTGGNILIAGFAIAGSGSMDLLLRGVGPALIPAPFGVTGALTNTQLTLYDTVNPNNPLPIVTNSGWSNAFTRDTSTVNVAPQAATLALMNTLGAFTNNWAIGSPDSALEVTPPVGGYTAQISGVGGATGVALAEVYDIDAYAPGTRLVNLSTRAQVGTGASILIGGFVIGGSTAETLLIRAVGPTLAGAPYDVGGTIAQPVLTIYAGSTPIYANSNWGGDATISTAINTVGAFPLNPSSSDAAVLITLPPASNYTAQVSGVSNTTGVALLEVYDVF